jgi:5-methylthioadenosine/S-adenosylhomocysteine deaminase
VTTRTLLRGGCVLTLGARSSNLAEGDVLLDDGLVAEVGRGLRARDAEEIDAADTIVMPGFVDTHRHAWTSLFRNLGGSDPSSSREHFAPDDVYAATLIGLLGAVEAGITTVVDHCDLPLDDDAVEAALRAHADAGLRTSFVFADPERPATRERLERLQEVAGPSTSIAVGTGGTDDPERAAAAWAVARELGLRIHAHDGPQPAAPGTVAALGARGLLGEDVTLIHRAQLDDTDLEAIASSGSSVSLAPSSEMAEGFGSPPIQALIDRDVQPGLGVDHERVAPGDLFAQMRQTISLQHATVFDRKLMGKAGLPRLMTTRDVIRSATVGGARVAGLAGVAGSLEPGLQADVLVLRTDRPNIFPVNDPIGAVVWGMDTSNIDHVFVAGRALVRDGVLAADVARARDLATGALRRVAAASGLTVGAALGGAA